MRATTTGSSLLSRRTAQRHGSSAAFKPLSTRVKPAAAANTATDVPTTSFASDPTFKFASILNGCWQLAGGHGREVYENIGEKLMAHAEAGFTTFDTADIYGPSEEILGQFQAARRDAGKPPVQVFTKYVPNIFQSRPTPANVEASIRRSLKSLQVQQLDLVQMHWWDYEVAGMVDAAKSLADLQAKGLIKHVGLTNMNVDAVAQIVDAGVPVACNQVQFSLLDRRPLNGMVQYCAPKGIKLFTYGSVAGGLLSDKYVEEPRKGMFGGTKYSNVDLNTSSLKMYWNVARQFGGQDLWRELLLALKGVATRHNVSVAAVALRWVMQQGGGNVVHPIVGLRGVQHIQDNATAFTFELDAADLAAVDAVLSRAQGPKGDIYSFERGG